jgi:uncharacterized membrane protein (TIGR02234 family)
MTAPARPTGTPKAASSRAVPLKYLAILLALAGSGLALAASTQNWYSYRLAASSGHAGVIVATGSNAAPAIAALSVAGLAFAAALALAGPVLRYILSALGLVLAASIIGSTVSAMHDPVGSGIGVITGATGVAGDASVRALVEHADGTAFPVLALVGGILIALGAVVVIATSHLWPRASRRYAAVRTERVASAEDGPVSEVDARTRARDAAIDDWDELSRGDDPTEGDEDGESVR